MMTKRSAIVLNVISKMIICITLLAIAGCKSSCWTQPGETAAEGDRRHKQVLSTNQQSLSGDIDRAFLFDKPSQATPLRTPQSDLATK
jgi:hypothetical protein